jgi:hypothetical protein
MEIRLARTMSGVKSGLLPATAATAFLALTRSVADAAEPSETDGSRQHIDRRADL